MTPEELNLATCSFREFRAQMGVPIGTAVGRNKRPPFDNAPQCDPLKPWTTFRKMDDAPLEARIARYQRQLDETEARVLDRLCQLGEDYRGETLVLLCWCYLPQADTGPMGCHRRWAAQWFARRHIDVPEFGASGETRRRTSTSPDLPLLLF